MENDIHDMKDSVEVNDVLYFSFLLIAMGAGFFFLMLVWIFDRENLGKYTRI